MTTYNQDQETKPTTPNIIRWPQVHSKVSICRSHAHDLIKRGEFPKPIKLGGKNARASGWIESEIDQWINERIAESRASYPLSLENGNE